LLLFDFLSDGRYPECGEREREREGCQGEKGRIGFVAGRVKWGRLELGGSLYSTASWSREREGERRKVVGVG
jgi:hypothetical protein